MSNFAKVIIILAVLIAIGFIGRSIYFINSDKTVDEIMEDTKSLAEDTVNKSLEKADEAVKDALDQAGKSVEDAMDKAKENVKKELGR